MGLFLCMPCFAGVTSQRQNWGFRRRPIIYLVTSTVTRPNKLPPYRTYWHIAWCRPHMGVRLRTEVISLHPDLRGDHFAPHWVYNHSTRGKILVAVNGAVFNQSVVPPIPVGGVGCGKAGWQTGSDSIQKKYCLGISGTLTLTREGYPAFKVLRMHYVYSRPGTGANDGQSVAFYSVAPLIKKHYPYGFGCVGLLIDHGRVIADPAQGGWEDGASLHPQMLVSRTLLAWTARGDCFIITANGPDNTIVPSAHTDAGGGASWTDTARFLALGLPSLIDSRYRYLLPPGQKLKLVGAVMFDGGGSTQFGYERVDRAGNCNKDRGAPHGRDQATDRSRSVPSFLYAASPDVARRIHRRGGGAGRHRYNHAGIRFRKT